MMVPGGCVSSTPVNMSFFISDHQQVHVSTNTLLQNFLKRVTTFLSDQLYFKMLILWGSLCDYTDFKGQGLQQSVFFLLPTNPMKSSKPAPH